MNIYRQRGRERKRRCVVLWAATVASRPMGRQGEVLGGWKVSVVGAVAVMHVVGANQVEQKRHS